MCTFICTLHVCTVGCTCYMLICTYKQYAPTSQRNVWRDIGLAGSSRTHQSINPSGAYHGRRLGRVVQASWQWCREVSTVSRCTHLELRQFQLPRLPRRPRSPRSPKILASRMKVRLSDPFRMFVLPLPNISHQRLDISQSGPASLQYSRSAA